MALKKITLNVYDWASVIAALDEHNPPDGFVTTSVTIQQVPQEGYSVQIVVEDDLSIVTVQVWVALAKMLQMGH